MNPYFRMPLPLPLQEGLSKICFELRLMSQSTDRYTFSHILSQDLMYICTRNRFEQPGSRILLTTQLIDFKHIRQ